MKSTPRILVLAAHDRGPSPLNRPSTDLNPHIAAVLIALAQRQRARKQNLGEAVIETHLLVLTNIKNAMSLCLYSGRVPSSTLDGIRRPSRYIEREQFHITPYQIPLENSERTIESIHNAILLAFPEEEHGDAWRQYFR